MSDPRPAVQADEVEMWIVFYRYEQDQKWYSQGPLHETPAKATEWFKLSIYKDKTIHWLATSVVVPRIA